MMNFTKPTIEKAIGKLHFTWPEMELKVVADRITDAGTAELWFYHRNDTGDALLHTTKANLLSTSTMGQIAKRMAKNSEDIPWQQVLTFIASYTMEALRQGEPFALIEPDINNISPPGYFVEPVVLKGAPSIIFGDKGVAKSTLAVALLGIIDTGDTDNPTEFSASEKANVGMLDWESSQKLTEYTLARLIKGKTIKPFALPYLRCKQPLAEDVAHIAEFIRGYKISVLLLDSLGQAAGSAKFDSAGKDAALKFFEALRQLNTTTLIIAQNAKGENENKKTIYGSTYYNYYARNVFELRGNEDKTNENCSHLALFHQEANYSKKYPPMGFCVDYTDTTISISRESVSMADFSQKASQTKALLDFLKDGAKSVQTIQTGLGVSERHARTLLSRTKKRGLTVDLGSGIWGLAVSP